MNKIHKTLIIIILNSASFFLYGNNLNNKKDSILASNYYQAGRTLYSQGLTTESLDSFLVALDHSKKFYGNNSYQLGKYFLATAIGYKNIGMLDDAIKYSLLAEQSYIKEFGDEHVRLAGIYNNLGNIYRDKLNYEDALRYYEQGLKIYLNQQEPNQSRIADVSLGIAKAYYLMYQYNKAIEIYEENFQNADKYIQLLYLELVGAIYQETKDIQKAKYFYEKAINYSIDIYSESDIYVAVEYLNFALFLSSIGNSESALSYTKKAYSIISLYEKGRGENIAEYYRVTGNVFQNKHIESSNISYFKDQIRKNYELAVDNYKNALYALNFPTEISQLQNMKEIESKSIFSALDILKLIAEAYNGLALSYEGSKDTTYQNNLNKSIDYYDVISKLLQRTKKEFTDDNSRILLAGLEQNTFIKTIQTSFRAYELNQDKEYLEKAFKNAELLKSGSLFDKLSNDAAMKNSLITDSLMEKEQKINSSITNYEQLKYDESIAETPNKMEIARFDSLLFILKRQRTDLNTYLENAYPEYYQLKYSDNTLAAADIQKKLKANQILLEYTLNETDSISELYTFFISKDDIQFNQQKLDKSFVGDIDETFHFMANPRYIFTKNEDSKKFCIASNLLYNKLIKPYKNEIKDKELIIIPDGKLSYVSFDALLTDLPDTTSIIHFNKLDYFIKRNCINYSYSANLIYNTNQTKRKAKKSILAFAPEYNSDSITIGKDIFPLRPLPGTQKEVDLIASEVKTEVYKGLDANEANFREKSENYDILHLAMHAFINDSLPSLSQFAFTQNKNGNINSDGLLSTADIYNLNLNARLSVLSACNTGTGQLKKGEGVISLARGFLYAGCPSIVMTLWEVEDNSGTKIMSSFYKYLKTGKNKDQALRLAKLDYLASANSRLAHPHYWLGYVSIGQNTPLYRSYDFYFFSLLLLSIIGVIIEQIIRIKKTRKKRV